MVPTPRIARRPGPAGAGDAEEDVHVDGDAIRPSNARRPGHDVGGVDAGRDEQPVNAGGQLRFLPKSNCASLVLPYL